MTHVTALAQHILALEPDKDAARLSFYHFLKNLCEATEPLTSELINRFYSRALNFTHWQENKPALFNEVTAILHHFQETHRVQLPLHKTVTADSLQVFTAENIQVLEMAVSRFLERHIEPTSQFRTFREGNDRIVAVILQEDRSLRVAVFSKVLAIKEGELMPLNQDFVLQYTPDLNLNAHQVQQLEVGPHVSARFTANPEGIFGTLVRGYTFQRYATMEGGPLTKHPFLFYPLKRLEQFFVYRKSDQMYLELTELLEKALDLVNQKHPEALKFATAALERGRLAFEHIYSDDKVIQLLINNLEKTLTLESARVAAQKGRRGKERPVPPLASPGGPISLVSAGDEPPPGTFEIPTAFVQKESR